LKEEKMTNLVEQFQAKTKLKAKSELIKYCCMDIVRKGTKNIKEKVADALRTANDLEAACQKYISLTEQQKHDFMQAAQGMRELANDYAQLAVWGKAFKEHYSKVMGKKRAAELEEIPNNRWGKDVDAMKFDESLITKLMTEEGQIAFAEWLHSQSLYTNFEKKYIFTPFEGYRERGLKKPIHKLASKIQYGKGMIKSESSRKLLFCSWDLYESYLSHCKQKIEA
jgi:hypothetical protein